MAANGKVKVLDEEIADFDEKNEESERVLEKRKGSKRNTGKSKNGHMNVTSEQ